MLQPVNWTNINSLPNLAFIKSRQGHQTIADVLVPLLDSSPLWTEHLTRIDVHALSSPHALKTGLEEALELCQRADELWIIALVRGGGASKNMENFAQTLLSKEVKPLLESIASRLIFAGGHTRDASRYEWLRPLCLSFGVVPLDAAKNFTQKLSAEGVFRRVHQSANHSVDTENGLPAPKDLYQLNLVRERERFAGRVEQRYKNMLNRAPIIMDREFIELIHRGGVFMGFRQITSTDYRALAFSQDYMLFQSDSFYDLEMWREILELAGLEEWEIDEALNKADGGIL